MQYHQYHRLQCGRTLSQFQPPPVLVIYFPKTLKSVTILFLVQYPTPFKKRSCQNSLCILRIILNTCFWNVFKNANKTRGLTKLDHLVQTLAGDDWYSSMCDIYNSHSVTVYRLPILWNVTPCNLLQICNLHTLKMEKTGSSKKWVNFYRLHTSHPEDGTFHIL